MAGGLLEGRSVIVTGAGRGIGRAIAERAAAEGASVVVADFGGALDRSSDASASVAEGVADGIRRSGGAAIASGADVSKADDVEAMIQAALSAFGRVDGLVCAAGLYVHKPLLETSEREWDDVIGSHLKGHFLCTRAAGRVMAAQGSGSVVHFSSAAALGTPIASPAYNSAKAGILGFSRGAALDLGPQGVRVNCVLPGASTRMTDRIYDAIGMLRPDAQGRPPKAQPGLNMAAGPGLASENAAGTWRDPANVAPFVCFLLSGRASEVNGQAFAVVGRQVTHVGERAYGTTIRSDGPWTLEALERAFTAHIAPALEIRRHGWPPP